MTKHEESHAIGYINGWDACKKIIFKCIEDYPQFEGIKSTVKEMKSMNSYFANMLIEQMMNQVFEQEDQENED